MPATPSSLQLESYFLKELSYFLKDSLDAAPSEKTNAKTVDLEITDLTVPLDTACHKWRCELTIQAKNLEEKHFYDFKIVMVGFFAVDSKVESEMAKLLAETNAPAVLYSTSREIVATVTRRSPYPATLLPAVTFLRETYEAVKVKKTTKKSSK